MYIIVVGGGAVGYGLALELQQMPDHEVTIVELSGSRTSQLRAEIGEMVVHGDGSEIAFLEGVEAGLQEWASAADEELSLWLQQVVAPIDRLLAQVINPFPAQLRELSADPYDDSLMEAFCAFLSQSQARLEKVESLYRSRACPAGAQAFALNLYHCLSQVQDALRDLERYTMGYVDSYLRDGRELLREAKRLRSQLLAERRQLEL